MSKPTNFEVLPAGKTLTQQIEYLLNRASRENVSNTPDFILAQYLLDSLEAFEKATKRRSAWWCKGDNFESKDTSGGQVGRSD